MRSLSRSRNAVTESTIGGGETAEVESLSVSHNVVSEGDDDRRNNSKFGH